MSSSKNSRDDEQRRGGGVRTHANVFILSKEEEPPSNPLNPQSSTTTPTANNGLQSTGQGKSRLFGPARHDRRRLVLFQRPKQSFSHCHHSLNSSKSSYFI